MLPYSVTLILYNIFLSFFVPYLAIVANQTRLGISAAQSTTLSGYWTTWQTTFAAYLNPVTYGTVNTGAINDLYAIILPYIANIQQQIKNNPTVTLTTLDYVVLAIHKNLARRSKIPAPTAQPVCAVKEISHLNVEFIVFDLARPTSAAKPKDVLRITPFMILLAHGSPVPTFDQLVQMADENRMTFDVPFTTAQLGMDGYMAVCFTNDAGSSKPSPIVPFDVI
jgi:hypothetical protein